MGRFIVNTKQKLRESEGKGSEKEELEEVDLDRRDSEEKGEDEHQITIQVEVLKKESSIKKEPPSATSRHSLPLKQAPTIVIPQEEKPVMSTPHADPNMSSILKKGRFLIKDADESNEYNEPITNNRMSDIDLPSETQKNPKGPKLMQHRVTIEVTNIYYIYIYIYRMQYWKWRNCHLMFYWTLGLSDSGSRKLSN